MRYTIPSDRFEENSDIIISDLRDAYVEDEGDKVSTYVPFSATSVCSVEVSYDDKFRRCASHKMYRLTNEENIDNLYALCVTLNEDNNARREVRVTLKVNGCSGLISKTSQFLITQEACTYFT